MDQLCIIYPWVRQVHMPMRRLTKSHFLGQYPISIAVTMVNALTLVVTTLTSYAIGESKLSFDEFIGMTLVLSGIILCKL